MKILHFADAHIDIATHGRRNPASGLPVRAHDFLDALDFIVNTAIEEKVDLVLFAGDAYKDRTPVPTFQREWGKRMTRLSRAGIPTLLLVGNHDLSPAVGRAHAMQEYETLDVAHVHAISKPLLLKPENLEGLPLQIIAVPWINRSTIVGQEAMSVTEPDQVFIEIEQRLTELVKQWLDKDIDPTLPVLLTAHASVQGAVYAGERSVMLGGDLVLSGSLVRDPRLCYVALGHIHKAQDLNKGFQPPVIYPGSIERVDFGEVADEKKFVIAHIQQGEDTRVEWRTLPGRRFIDRFVRVTEADGMNEDILNALPEAEDLQDAMVRLVIEYPAALEKHLDEQALRRHAIGALQFHLVRRPQREIKIKLPGDQGIASLPPLDLVKLYWRSTNTEETDIEELQKMARAVMDEANGIGESADV